MATWKVAVKQLASLECTIVVEYVLCSESEFEITFKTYATHIHMMNKNGYFNSVQCQWSIHERYQ